MSGYYSRQHEEPRIIQVLPVPRPVTAVFDNGDGTEFRESVILIALDSSGDVTFLTVDEDGIFDNPDRVSNFIRYEFT